MFLNPNHSAAYYQISFSELQVYDRLGYCIAVWSENMPDNENSEHADHTSAYYTGEWRMM